MGEGKDREEPVGGDATPEAISKLRQRTAPHERYRLEGELARGGQGAILRVWDDDLQRHLAMKVVLAHERGGRSSQETSRALARFLDEAQVTGQLDHPGIVPVHELGLDAQGQVFFTMKLVKGKTLEEVFDELARGEGEWTQTRVLSIVLRVCEAMSYAHAKGVVHRDLKPANVMVGRFGEVYVMDWGLARVLDREDDKDIRIRPPETSATSEVHTARQHGAGSAPDSPLVTMDGDVVGTPAYMSPEQAAGRLDDVGPQSDVYALGAMLYQLLAGHMPYVPPGVSKHNYAIWRSVQEGPPASLAGAASDAPAELVAISDKAMARDRNDRYADVSALADDLRAFVEGRVVRAYETGAVAEARKWIGRNRVLATAFAAGILLLIVGLVTTSILKREADVHAAHVEGLLEREDSLRDMRLAMKYSFILMRQEPALETLDRIDARHKGWLWRLVRDSIERRKYDTPVSLQDGLVVYDLEFSPDGTKLLSAGGGAAVNVWSVGDRHKLRSFPTAAEKIYSATFSPDGALVVAGGDDGHLTIGDVRDGTAEQFQFGEAQVCFVAFLGTSDTVLFVTRDGRAFEWAWREGSPPREVYARDGVTVLTGAVSGAQQTLALGLESGAVLLVDLRQPDADVVELEPLEGNVLQLRFVDEDRRLVVGGNRLVRVYEDLADPRTVDWQPANAVSMEVVEDAATGEVVVLAGGRDGRLKFYGARAGMEIVTLTLDEHWVTSLAISPDGETVAASSRDGQLSLLELGR